MKTLPVLPGQAASSRPSPVEIWQILLSRLLDQHYGLTLNDTPFADERVIEQHIEAGISLCDAVNFLVEKYALVRTDQPGFSACRCPVLQGGMHMLGNFEYVNPTKLYFGNKSLDYLQKELLKYGKNIVLIYGGGSIKKNGIYDQVLEILKACDKNVVEDAGVMPNPTSDKLIEGAKIAKAHKADLLLAVGGGSVCDYAKAVSVSAYCDDDPWEKYFIRMENIDNPVIPVGCVLTMVGTGSEMNGGSVITNRRVNRKIGRVFKEDVFPKFSILTRMEK